MPIWYFVGFLWVQGCKLRGSQLPSPTISSTFLQGTMDLRHALITYPQRHLTNSACCLRTFNNFYLPPSPPSVEYGGERGRGGVRGDVSITDFRPPLQTQIFRGSVLGGSNIHRAFPIGKKYEGVKIVAYIFWTSPMLTPHGKGGDSTDKNPTYITGYLRNLNWRYLLYIGLCKAYVREYP